LGEISKMAEENMFDPKIKDIIKRNNKLLSISQDYWDDKDDLTQRTAVLYWSPYTLDTEHDHISMNQDEARALYEWLKELNND
jgi:hypothetical protein